MIRPVVVTQLTCEAVLGVKVEDWLSHVAANTTSTEATAVSSDREWSAEAVLARRGLRAVGGAR
jgi:hypothetical protein